MQMGHLGGGETLSVKWSDSQASLDCPILHPLSLTLMALIAHC